MAYMTDLKRAVGMGSAREGTHHHWSMTKSSVALLILVPLFIFTFGPMTGQSHEAVTEYFARPFPAIVAALTLVVGFMHFKNGVQALLEDYVHGLARKIIIILTICLSYGAAATGLFAIAKIAL
ncbi:MAG: succinate dehydrogenase, hydrophobic membrane anchor protein [Boseongicola sp.]|nr:MAG: succinate dehydrogenase, hydrophobic membrane anchor protein [Boseongicola sp.]